MADYIYSELKNKISSMYHSPGRDKGYINFSYANVAGIRLCNSEFCGVDGDTQLFLRVFTDKPNLVGLIRSWLPDTLKETSIEVHKIGYSSKKYS
jgi:hypothetical protein